MGHESEPPRPITRQQTWMGDRPSDGSVGVGPPTAEAQYLSRFGHLFDDLVLSSSRLVRPLILCMYIAIFIQRCVTALVFGLFHFQQTSLVQLGLLATLHVAVALYFAAVRPYKSVLLLVSDLIAYGCELSILVCAGLLLRYKYNIHLGQALVACYYLDIFAVLVPDIAHLACIAWQRVKGRSRAPPALPPEQVILAASTPQAAGVTLHDSGAAAAAAAALRLTADGMAQH